MPRVRNPSGATGEEGISREVKIVAAVVVLGATMSVLDTTIVNVALDRLSRDLHSPLSTIQWVSTGYLLSLAMVIPLAGWLTQRFGSKRVWMISVAVFAARGDQRAQRTSTPRRIDRHRARGRRARRSNPRRPGGASDQQRRDHPDPFAHGPRPRCRTARERFRQHLLVGARSHADRADPSQHPCRHAAPRAPRRCPGRPPASRGMMNPSVPACARNRRAAVPENRA